MRMVIVVDHLKSSKTWKHLDLQGILRGTKLDFIVFLRPSLFQHVLPAIRRS